MKIKLIQTSLLLGLCLSTNAGKAQSTVPQLGKSPVSEVVKAMTLEEKVHLVIGQGMYVPGMPMPGSGLPPTEAQEILNTILKILL
jgi:beta-glucosidase